MIPDKYKPYVFSVFWILLVILADRLTKGLALAHQIPRDLGIFTFRYVENTGASFGILQGQNILLTIIAAVIFVVLILAYKHIPKVPFVLIMAGLIGNVVDRIVFGFVVDFIDLGWWPVFNLADSALFVGVAYWVILEIRNEIKKIKTRP